MSSFHDRYAKIRGEQKVEELKQQGQLAALIQQVRKAKGLSQQQLADLMDMPKSTIGRIETGITTPKIETLQALAKALQLTITLNGFSISIMPSDFDSDYTQNSLSQ